MKIYVDIDDTICRYENESDKTDYNQAKPILNSIKSK